MSIEDDFVASDTSQLGHTFVISGVRLGPKGTGTVAMHEWTELPPAEAYALVAEFQRKARELNAKWLKHKN
jgi:hypothetical protein